jgi:hypothetical protein
MQPRPVRSQPAFLIDGKSPVPQRIGDVIERLPDGSIWGVQRNLQPVAVLDRQDLMSQPDLDPPVGIYPVAHRHGQRHRIDGDLG